MVGLVLKMLITRITLTQISKTFKQLKNPKKYHDVKFYNFLFMRICFTSFSSRSMGT